MIRPSSVRLQRKSGGASRPADGYKLEGATSVMSTNLYVGNLTFSTTSEELESLFAEHGEVTRAVVITDRDTGRSRGFGFVEMADNAGGDAAIKGLNGTNMGGRNIKVNEARPRNDRPRQARW